MTQNIYDDPGFFGGYSQLRRSRLGLDGAAEWPLMRAMLPDMTGLKVADLGCGFGWFCRWAAEAGAARVLGLDVSEKMLARAAAETNDARIAYQRADLERLSLPRASFDLAYSSLALHYVRDLPGLLASVHAGLAPGGRLAFSIEHPIYMAPRRPGWTKDEDGRSLWPLDGYMHEGERVTDWLAKGVVKQHRTLATTLNALIGAGFALRRLEEFGPSHELVAAQPELAAERERPMFLLVAADRT